jgi:hypothetical protein
VASVPAHARRTRKGQGEHGVRFGRDAPRRPRSSSPTSGEATITRLSSTTAAASGQFDANSPTGIRHQEQRARRLVQTKLLDSEAPRARSPVAELMQPRSRTRSLRRPRADIDALYEQNKQRLGGRTREMPVPTFDRQAARARQAERRNAFLPSCARKSPALACSIPPRDRPRSPRKPSPWARHRPQSPSWNSR